MVAPAVFALGQFGGCELGLSPAIDLLFIDADWLCPSAVADGPRAGSDGVSRAQIKPRAVSRSKSCSPFSSENSALHTTGQPHIDCTALGGHGVSSNSMSIPRSSPTATAHQPTSGACSNGSGSAHRERWIRQHRLDWRTPMLGCVARNIPRSLSTRVPRTAFPRIPGGRSCLRVVWAIENPRRVELAIDCSTTGKRSGNKYKISSKSAFSSRCAEVRVRVSVACDLHCSWMLISGSELPIKTIS